MRTFIGHPEAAAHAPFAYEFLRHWLAQEPVAGATAAGNAFTEALYRRLALLGNDEPARAFARSNARIAGDSSTRVDDAP